jgi:hypothetical protein
MRKESAMPEVNRQYEVVSLAHQAMFDVSDASVVALRCDEGCVWITLDDDPRDIVLEAGESFETDQRRHALVYALQESTLVVRGSAAEHAPRHIPVMPDLIRHRWQ